MARNKLGNETAPAPIPGPKGAEGQNLFPSSEDDYGATLTNLSLGDRFPLSDVSSPVQPDPGPLGSGSAQTDGRNVPGISGEPRDKTNRYTAELVRAANHHDDDGNIIWTQSSDTVQPGRLPQTSGPPIGKPTAANPSGAHFPESLEGGTSRRP